MHQAFRLINEFMYAICSQLIQLKNKVEQKATKNARLPTKSGVFLELIARFELATSSLPKVWKANKQGLSPYLLYCLMYCSS